MGKIKEKFKNPRWRLNNLYWITDKNSHRILFKENEFQERLNELHYDMGVKKIQVLKSRQVGCTTNELLKQFDATIWNKNFNAFIMAHDRSGIEKLFRIPTRAYKYMDPRIRPEIDRGGGSKYELRFPQINSMIACGLESRGETINWLHISEAAFIKDPHKILDTIEAVPKGGTITWETTPNGMGNLFFDEWANPNDYEKVFFPWFLFKEYALDVDKIGRLDPEEKEFCRKAKKGFGVTISKGQIAWRRAKKMQQKAGFTRNYPEDDVSCFLSGVDLPVDLLIIKDLIDEARPAIFQNDHKAIYEKLDRSDTYVIGADTSEGVNRDYSVATVFKIRTREQVAQIRSNQWKPGEFAYKIKDLAKEFTAPGKMPPLVAVERNNHGHAVLLKLDETIEYANLYRASDEKLGWRTDMISRPLMIDTFVEGLENRMITINDLDTLRECQTLVNVSGKIQAAVNKTDDCVIAAAIALQVVVEYAAEDTYKNIEDKFRV